MEYTEDCPYPIKKIISPNSTNPLPNPRVSRGCCEDQPLPPEKPMSTLYVYVWVWVNLCWLLTVVISCNKPLSYLQLVEWHI